MRRVHSFSPKVLVLDYLELILSRRDAYNDDEYQRQKHVATELCGLAKTNKMLVYSATQTNRSGASQQRPGEDGRPAGVQLNQAAESFGKLMPVDYVISLNQDDNERTAEIPTIRMLLIKNREGPKSITITCTVNYETMKVQEHII